jgi:DNA (cytosine-5)-methyltransferase 1
VLAEARPRRFVLENVYALTYNNRASRPAYERLLREIDAAGYHCTAKVLNAADYGVPQSRPRLFIIGAPKDEPAPDHARPSHGGQWERRVSGDPQRPHVTTGEALAGLVADPEPGEEVNGKYGHLLPDIPPGDNYLFYTDKRDHPAPIFKWRSKYWSFLLKLAPDKPAPTIQAQPGPYVGPFHWDNRRLRTAEIKRLFTYPDEFELVGRRASVQAQLGNSVPPLLGSPNWFRSVRALGCALLCGSGPSESVEDRSSGGSQRGSQTPRLTLACKGGVVGRLKCGWPVQCRWGYPEGPRGPREAVLSGTRTGEFSEMTCFRKPLSLHAAWRCPRC